MSAPKHPLTPEFERLLNARGVLKDLPALARKVLSLSDFYLANPGSPTPWNEAYAADAYLAYFMPLNFVRLRAAWQEVKRFIPEESIAEIWDFGSGIGTTQWVLKTEGITKPFHAIESSPAAQRLYRDTLGEVKFVTAATPGPNAMAVFSYSFLEMQKQLPSLAGFEHLLIVEPSMREMGRTLMQWRGALMHDGFAPLAPCTHSEDCPLLTKSGRDWCHMRVHLDAPAWFTELEEHLPMKNRTLTYSYLLMSRSIKDQAWRGTARVIGDTLKENGKTRQMICRGPEREFLSWLHKAGPPPEIPHGSLVRGVEQTVAKSGELRPAAGSITWTEDAPTQKE